MGMVKVSDPPIDSDLESSRYGARLKYFGMRSEDDPSCLRMFCFWWQCWVPLCCDCVRDDVTRSNEAVRRRMCRTGCVILAFILTAGGLVLMAHHAGYIGSKTYQ